MCLATSSFGDRPGGAGDRPDQRHDRLDGEGVCVRQPAPTGQALTAPVWLSTRHAGEGDPDRPGPGRVDGWGVGLILF